MMRVEIRFFASLAETTGCSVESVDLSPGADVRALWELLLKRHPALAEIGFRPMVACDRIRSRACHFSHLCLGFPAKYAVCSK